MVLFFIVFQHKLTILYFISILSKKKKLYSGPNKSVLMRTVSVRQCGAHLLHKGIGGDRWKGKKVNRNGALIKIRQYIWHNI